MGIKKKVCGSVSDWTHDRLKASLWKGEPWVWAHAKLDGFRATVFSQDDGRLVVYGRDIRPHLELTHRFAAVSDSTWLARLQKNMPPRSSVDGELVAAGSCSSGVPTALRGTPDDLRFVAFAIPMWNGVELVSEVLPNIRRRCEVLGLEFVPTMEGSDTKFCRTRAVEDQKAALLAFAKQYGYEGWVLKISNYNCWYKVKEEKTVDCFVVGTKEGNGKYLGLVGALEVALLEKSGERRTIASVSGMTDAERVEITELDNSDQLHDRVCEIAYQCVGAKGRLRHPRFKRWRPDKPKEECGVSQIEA